MGLLCAFLIIWAVFPEASMNPSLLSSAQVAKTNFILLLLVPDELNWQYLAEDL